MQRCFTEHVVSCRLAPLHCFFSAHSACALAACKTLARPNRRPLVLSPTSAFLPSRRLRQRKAGSAVAVISSEAGHLEKIALMPRVLVALASVGLRASSFTLATQRRQPNAFRRNMGALQSTVANSVRHTCSARLVNLTPSTRHAPVVPVAAPGSMACTSGQSERHRRAGAATTASLHRPPTRPSSRR